jgi:hypothetical protein
MNEQSTVHGGAGPIADVTPARIVRTQRVVVGIRSRRWTARVLVVVGVSLSSILVSNLPESVVVALASGTTTYVSYSGTVQSCARVGGNLLDRTTQSPCGSYPRSATSLYAAEAAATEDPAGDFSVSGDVYTIDAAEAAGAESVLWIGANFHTTTAQSITVTMSWTVSASTIATSPANSKLNYVEHHARPYMTPTDSSSALCSNGTQVHVSSGGVDFSASGPGPYTYRVTMTCASGTVAASNWAGGLSISYDAGANLGEAQYSLAGQLQSVTVTLA